jgi:hypothetical protein
VLFLIALIVVETKKNIYSSCFHYCGITNGRKEKFGNKGRSKEGRKRLQEGLADLARGLAPIEN